MNSEESIFLSALNLSAHERQAYVRQACAGDPVLFDRIQELLDEHDNASGILDLAETQGLRLTQNTLLEGHEIGPYRLVNRLGEGGFGVVFEAEQLQPVHRRVALKIIKPGMDSNAVVTRFEAERQALAIMDHPNIARVFDGGAIDDGRRPYFVMELVNGVPITEYCDNHAMPIHGRLELFITVCRAVHHAHQKGVIHRDIKPNNVLVGEQDGLPNVKVIDFGIAKALDQRRTPQGLSTVVGAMIGTPQYMSPEQAGMSELDVDTRSDVYSLAVLFYELLTGTTPVRTEALKDASYQQVQRIVSRQVANRPSQRLQESSAKQMTLAEKRNTSFERLVKQVRGDLDWITMKGLEMDRDRRYDSANELANDLQRFLASQPVLAGPPSLTYRLGKFASRNRNRLVLSAAVVLLVAAVAIGLLNNQRHVRAARKKENSRISRLLDEANAALVSAAEDMTSDKLWTTVSLLSSQIQASVATGRNDSQTAEQALNFLDRYKKANQDRDFTLAMENLLLTKSTEPDIESWQFMEQEFCEILGKRGYALKNLSFHDVERQLKQDRKPLKVTDALELWLSTRIKISDAGGMPISQQEIHGWTEAMCVADPNPMRAAIRRTIFGTVDPDREFLSAAVSQDELFAACARKLSWLAVAYEIVGNADQASEIRSFALSQHANDLVLNFEYATLLMEQEKADEAIRYYMRCTALRPNAAGTWRSLARAYATNGELPAACETLNKALDLEPESAALYVDLAEWQLALGRLTDACRSAEAAISKDPHLLQALPIVGRARMLQSDYRQALVAFEKYRGTDHGNADDSVGRWIKECRQQIASSENE
ncbi:MAG TPA: serine/threonine protein kinase [Planctomycetaceae bacterium]|nr:serine/threonine protein kinase [Planctomycetaceae bacterium]